MQHVAPAMGQLERQGDVFAQGHAETLSFGAIDRNIDMNLGETLRRGSQILDRQRHADFFAKNGKSRGVADGQAAIPVGIAPGIQQMQRRRHIRRMVQIMQATVGQQDSPGNAALGLLRHRFG